MQITARSSWTWVGVTVAAALLILLTRLPFAPHYLLNFDAANFALSLEEFNPAKHQPQPPGYPLFVALLHLLHIFVPAVERALFIAGVAGSVAAALLAFKLGREMFGGRAGVIASLLLLLNPVFWYAGLMSQVRIYLSVVSLSVAFAAWRAWTEQSPKWFYAAAGLLGLLSGFRPDALVLLLPLLAIAGWRAGRSVGQYLRAGLILIATSLPWIVVIVVRSGGIADTVHMLTSYSRAVSYDSVLNGAGARLALQLAWHAVVWTFVGAVSWVWAVPLALPRLLEGAKRAGLFLTAWFVPAFLFHAIAHIRQADQALVEIPALCILGGWVVSRIRWNAPAVIASAAVAACALNVWLFLRPLSGPVWLASVKPVRWLDRYTVSAFEAVRQLERSGPVVFICAEGGHVTWRQLEYYFPQYTVIALLDQPDHVRMLRDRRTQELDQSDAIVLPARGTLVWFVPPGAEPELRQSLGAVAHGSALYTNPQSDSSFRFGKYRFVRR